MKDLLRHALQFCVTPYGWLCVCRSGRTRSPHRRGNRTSGWGHWDYRSRMQKLQKGEFWYGWQLVGVSWSHVSKLPDRWIRVSQGSEEQHVSESTNRVSLKVNWMLVVFSCFIYKTVKGQAILSAIKKRHITCFCVFLWICKIFQLRNKAKKLEVTPEHENKMVRFTCCSSIH